MQKTYNIEDDQKKISFTVKLIIAFIIVVACSLLTYNLFKAEILNFNQGKIEFNSYKIPIYGWAKEIKDSGVLNVK